MARSVVRSEDAIPGVEDHPLLSTAVKNMILLLLFSPPYRLGMVSQRPALRFCSGSVCAGYGAPLVLEAARGLTCAPACEVNVATATCMKACNKVPLDGLAAFVNGEQELLDPAADAGQALRIAFDALGQPAELEAMRQAIESTVAGDAALNRGDAHAAVAAYSAALGGVPARFLQREQLDAAAATADADADVAEMRPAPPNFTGLGPSRLAAALSRERERTTPGRVR